MTWRLVPAAAQTAPRRVPIRLLQASLRLSGRASPLGLATFVPGIPQPAQKKIISDQRLTAAGRLPAASAKIASAGMNLASGQRD
jgi:hypothetical protein